MWKEGKEEMTTVIEGAAVFVDGALENFQANIAFMRIKRELTYADLGIRAGMTERNAYQIVNGKQGANIRTVAALAHAFQVPVSDLFMDAERFAIRYAKAKPFAPLGLAAGKVKRVKRTWLQSPADLHEPIPA